MASDSLKSSKDQWSADLSIILELFRINSDPVVCNNSRIIFVVGIKFQHRFDMLKVFAVHNVIENFRIIVL